MGERLNSSGQADATMAGYMYPGKQFLRKFNGNTNASAAELIADVVLSRGVNDFVGVPSGLTVSGLHSNPHLHKGKPAGGNGLFLDGHASWRRFKEIKERYNNGDRDVRWWF
jgi:prepilin-type processing-associated H-X9-DG protein